MAFKFPRLRKAPPAFRITMITFDRSAATPAGRNVDAGSYAFSAAELRGGLPEHADQKLHPFLD